ncbi:MmcQ/YjbR family DNA-binding protein [Spirillospora sp. CA-253888]
MPLSGHELQDTARAAALVLPGTDCGYPFTEHLQVHKVAGKVFLIVTEDPDEPIITVKAEPEHGRLLQNTYASITAGRYLNKRHWISVGAGPGVTADLVAELVDHSYHLVSQTVARGRRPR